MLHCSEVSGQLSASKHHKRMACQSHRLSGAHEVPFLKASKLFCRSDRLVSSLFVKKSPMVVDIFFNFSIAITASSKVALLCFVA